jgi:nitrite reductase/ring-hydroxylating ferredoxin subunit
VFLITGVLVGDAYKRRIRHLGIKYPNHGHRFDLKAGECHIDPAFNTKVYPIKVEADSILIDFD